MSEKIKNFRDLKIWQKGIELVEDIYKITKGFPKEELYGLTSQMRRCAVSIPSNTAEGFSRKHNKEYFQFLNIVIGSCSELETQIEISLKLKFIQPNEANIIFEKINHITRMVMNLRKRLK